jgi:hypothetical protein
MEQRHDFRSDSPSMAKHFDRLAEIMGGVDKAFDAVAPLTIYHRADSRYRREALNAAGRLRRAIDKVDPESLPNALSALADPMRRYDYGNAVGDLLDLYNAGYAAVFERACRERGANFQYEIDRWGSRGYRCEGESIFGDDTGAFPWYMNARLIRDRVAELAPSQRPDRQQSSSPEP